MSDPTVGRNHVLDGVPVIGAALLVAAFVLAVASRGDVFVLALLLGFGSGRRSAALAAGAALLAAMVRWGSPALGAIAGAQAVVGPAGWTGSSTAVASAWFAAAALVLAGASLPPLSRRTVAVAAGLPFAAAAADVVAGPSAGGAIVWRVVVTIVGAAAMAVLPRTRLAPLLALSCGGLALVFAVIAR